MEVVAELLLIIKFVVGRVTGRNCALPAAKLSVAINTS
jgi:hypothetical protein